MADPAQVRKLIEPVIVDAICRLEREQVKEAVALLLDYIDAHAVPVPPPVIGESEAFAMFRTWVSDNAKALQMVANWGDGHCGALHEVLLAELQNASTIYKPLDRAATSKALPPDAAPKLAPLFPEDGGVVP